MTFNIWCTSRTHIRTFLCFYGFPESDRFRTFLIVKGNKYLIIVEIDGIDCFGCGANGDAIDLTAKLFDLNPRQAAEKLASDFGLDPDKPPANAIALPPPKRGLTDEQWADIAYCLRVLTDYLDLLHDWQERYKPASPEEPLDERFVEALHMTETIEHLTDCVAFGTPQQKAAAASQLLSGSYLLMLEERIDRLALAKCA